MTFQTYLAAAAIVCALASPSSVLAQDRTITVSGDGQVSVAPDIARISLGVLAQSQAAADAVAEMNQGMAALLDELSGAAIAPVDVQTSNLRLDQVYDNGSSFSGSGNVAGFVAASNVTVTVRDLGQLGQVLDAVIAAGVTNIDGLTFDVADRAPYVLAARQAAVVDAKAKADVYAGAAGVGVGAVKSISESLSGGSPVMAEARMTSDPGVQIAAGEITINAGVTIVYTVE